MAGRRERCSWCGVKLVVPAEAQTIQCGACHRVTRVNQPSINFNPLIQATHSINHAVSRLRTLMVDAAASPSSSTGTGWCSGAPAAAFGYYNPPPPPPPACQPSWPSVPKPLMPPSAYGRKRALLCGVSYHGRSYNLKGTVNDVNCMKYFLVNRRGFPADSIRMLTEYEADPYRIPTKQNIRMALQWLVQGCRSGDSLVFHFSGHGSTQPDYNMDEIDGYDETLCPVDFETQGMILDDEINATIVRPLPHGAKLHAIIDACHSGTVLDLPFLCRMNREGCYVWEDHGRWSSVYKGTSGGLAVSISACDDHQTSSDTTALSGDTSTGALTYSFIQAVENDRGLTYGYLLNAMRQIIREARSGIRLKGPIAALVNKVFGTEFLQEPQLTSSEKFDIYSKQFVL
ncbi:hypothetical protein PRUPE_8G059400 [Prunus persica]|uniref:Peptidase C14 caspase domain-containing protein n=1 Tax=Prunus persica TaxID=3760 RepID=M5VZ51_PRUPE|nr:metacaspase-1 [Prunus persica]ONH90525.1 hypothetical protein PRUPE_8G059400 [Prunus persica]